LIEIQRESNTTEEREGRMMSFLNRSKISFFVFLVISQVIVMGWGASSYSARQGQYVPEFLPCDPVSESTPDMANGSDSLQMDPLPQVDFCSKWNPEFAFNGHHCCAKKAASSRKRRKSSCSIERAKGNYCGEITSEQKEYTRLVQSGQVGDVLDLFQMARWRESDQAYCTVNNGFLAWGRRLIPSVRNRIALRSSDRCTEFGTDQMIGMLEWVGRQVGQSYAGSEYQGTRLVIGDISAPRGGCLSGRGGRRGHLSHTTGQDVDVAFLVAKANKSSPVSFHRDFDVKQNWSLLKQIFKNPFACIKVVFLDKRLISKLSTVAHKDQEWSTYQRFIRHMPGHRNHLHVRIGNGPGLPGCAPDAKPEFEQEEQGEDMDLDFLDEEDDYMARSQHLLYGATDASTETTTETVKASRQPSRSPSQTVNIQE